MSRLLFSGFECRQDTLNLDGSTDGGCETVDPIDVDDKYRKCPNTDTATCSRPDDTLNRNILVNATLPKATSDCANFFAPSAEVSMQPLCFVDIFGVISNCQTTSIDLNSNRLVAVPLPQTWLAGCHMAPPRMLAIIVGSTGGVIALCAILGIAVVRHVQTPGPESKGSRWP